MLIFLVKSKKQLVIIIENKSHEKHFVQITKLTSLAHELSKKVQMTTKNRKFKF